MATTKMVETFRSFWSVSVPLVVLRTADQGAAAAEIAARCDAQAVVQWDAALGITAVNKAGQAALKEARIDPLQTVNFVDAMVRLPDLPRGSIACVHNAHRQLHSMEPSATAQHVQAVANLRDRLKVLKRTAVLMGPLSFQVPAELEQDVMVLDHELPGPAELGALVTELHQICNPPLTPPAGGDMEKAVDAVTGLSLFAAEQTVTTSLRTAGLDLGALWERKRVAIEQTRGLAIYRGTETFDDIVGLGSVKGALGMRLSARRRVGVVVVLDEIDKTLANVEHDTTGSRTDQLRSLLVNMEDNEWEGVLLAGVPGGGKTLVGKAFGNMAGVPTVFMDLGAMEDKFVGESEAHVRAAMQRIKAIGNGRAYFLATSNNSTVMRPELQRRFTGGFFWVDLPTKEQRAAAWALYLKKYGLGRKEAGPLPDDDGWTAAEIRNCARTAWDCQVPLAKAAEFIVPVAHARVDEFNAMRMYANGRYLDASAPGKFDAKPVLHSDVTKRMLRAIDLSGEKVQ